MKLAKILNLKESHAKLVHVATSTRDDCKFKVLVHDWSDWDVHEEENPVFSSISLYANFPKTDCDIFRSFSHQPPAKQHLNRINLHV